MHIQTCRHIPRIDPDLMMKAEVTSLLNRRRVACLHENGLTGKPLPTLLSLVNLLARDDRTLCRPTAIISHFLT